jgi:Holliday junction resolvase
MPINSREKGKRGERELAAFLNAAGHNTRRGQQFKGGPESPDVVGLPGFHLEVKRTESLSIYKAMDQAISEAAPGNIPLVMHKRNRKDWLVVLSLKDFLSMLGKL